MAEAEAVMGGKVNFMVAMIGLYVNVKIDLRGKARVLQERCCWGGIRRVEKNSGKERVLYAIWARCQVGGGRGRERRAGRKVPSRDELLKIVRSGRWSVICISMHTLVHLSCGGPGSDCHFWGRQTARVCSHVGSGCKNM